MTWHHPVEEIVCNLLAAYQLLWGTLWEYSRSCISTACIWLSTAVDAAVAIQISNPSLPEITIFHNPAHCKEYQVQICDESTATLTQVADFIVVIVTTNALDNLFIARNQSEVLWKS